VGSAIHRKLPGLKACILKEIFNPVRGLFHHPILCSHAFKSAIIRDQSFKGPCLDIQFSLQVHVYSHLRELMKKIEDTPLLVGEGALPYD
jgi:hypothetical protein